MHYLVVTNRRYITSWTVQLSKSAPSHMVQKYQFFNGQWLCDSHTHIILYVHFLLFNVTSINRFTPTFKDDSQPISYIIRSYLSTLPFRLLYWNIIEVPNSWSSLVLKFYIKNKFLSLQNCCVFKFLVGSVSIWKLKIFITYCSVSATLINHMYNTYTE